MSHGNGRFVAVAVIFNPHDQTFLLQHRDSHASVNPNKWGLFGGSGEEGETPLQAIMRELEEEISITFPASDIAPLHDYQMEENGLHRYVYFITKFPQSQDIVLHEGQAYRWIPFNEIFTYDMSARTKKDFEVFNSVITPPQ